MPQYKKFSERMKLVSPRDKIQIESMDDDLRNAIWNALYIAYFRDFEFYWNNILNRDSELGSMFTLVWLELVNKPIDMMPRSNGDAIKFIKDLFFNSPWYFVYDLVEYIANTEKYETKKVEFRVFCNNIFEKYLSGYRFVEDVISPITSEIEIESIEKAIMDTSRFKPINIHLQEALIKLSDKTNPDYRNSIKESISAVESLCRLISGSNEATLGDALKKIEKKNEFKMHSALKNAFSNLYGWTSDAQGIRHSLMDEPNLQFDDAKFMLVSCSAFIHYLIIKTSQAGISFS